jgi:hexosaminidase
MRLKIGILFGLICAVSATASNLFAADLIPMPAQSEATLGTFSISAKTKIVWAGSGTKATAEFLADAIKQRTGLQLEIIENAAGASTSNVITLFPAPVKHVELDGTYLLRITPADAAILSTNDDGSFYGAISLLQLIDSQKITDGEGVAIPAVDIHDQPRFQWRGLMIDESRHFFGTSEIESILDSMAYLKMNRFHWHLTDEDAWRIEIKKYPKLQTIGASGNRSDPDAGPLFYTQDQIREIVAYATARHIMVIPEIDMPGHMAAVSRAYPELSGGGRGFTINPGKEESYTFCADVLTEILPLFPGPYLCIGGDEVSFGNQLWSKDPQIVKFAKDHGMANTLDLEKYFVKRMNDVVHKLGKTTVAWDDAAAADIGNQNTVLLWWHDKHPEKILADDYQMVLCPHVTMYFNSRQNESHVVLKQRPVTDLHIVYGLPDSVTKGIIPPGKEKNVLGIQACLWSEFIGDSARVNYMLYPRLAAFAEDAWTPADKKNEADFMKRLPAFLKELDRRHINYYDPFDPAKTPELPPPVIVRYVPRGRVDTGAPTTAPTAK